ncbi:conserved membrane-spanning protein [Paenibacillus pasadenensis]|uniref:Conserved membrane-spanning protein n=1 Tax=Paenibacillus pasadenensis TaxID=217090 RepID=A0A2N5N744_9BACL|nr:DUF4184 family protein [Paenibacillus pasadenensis]PLT46109.1 conserved membrane-spanning protein [Paenibacillus pasadenensis]
MPFTFSHPLFAVPLRRLAPSLSLSGLLLGSMTPDMEYFVAMEPFRSIGHSWQGFLLLGVPLSIAAAAAWRFVLAPLLPRLLPAALRLDRYAADRLAERRDPLLTPRAAGWFLLSLYIGFLSHLLVDGMTHTHGWFVLWQSDLMHARHAGLPLYRWLQYLFSLLGLLAGACWLAADYARWRRASRSARPAHPAVRPLAKLGGWTLAGACGLLLFAPKLLLDPSPDNPVLWLVAACSSLLFGLFAAGLLLRPGRILRKLAGAALVPLLAAGYKAAAMARDIGGPMAASDLPLWIGYVWLLSIAFVALSAVPSGRAAAAGAGGARRRSESRSGPAV